MTTLIFLLIAVAIAVLETTLLSGFLIFGGRPDLLLIITTYYAHRYGVHRGQIGGFIVGLIEDSLSASPFGFFALVRMAHSGLIGFTKGNVSGDAVITPVVLTGIAGIIRTIMIAILTGLFSIEGLFSRIFHVTTLIEFGLTLVAAPLVFFLLDTLSRSIGSSRSTSR